MIHTRNLGSEICRLTLPGTQSTTGIAQAVAVIPFDGYISNIYAKCVSQASTAEASFDINVEGTSILDTTKLTCSAGVVGYGTHSVDPVAVTAGSILSLDVDTPSDNPVVGFEVLVTISKTNDAKVKHESNHNYAF